MTQLELARKGTVSPQIKHVAEKEGVETDSSSKAWLMVKS